MTGSTNHEGTCTTPSAARMKVTEWASVKVVAARTISRRRREPGDQRQQEEDVVDPGVEVLGAEAEELPVLLEQRLMGGERRVLGVEARGTRLQVEVLVGDDRLGAADVALGVREQPAADGVRVGAVRTGVVEDEEGVRHALALGDAELAVLLGRARPAALRPRRRSAW